MPARAPSRPRGALIAARALCAVLLVPALVALGLTAAAPASAATGSKCYLWPTTIVGPGHSATLTAQIMTSGHTPVRAATAVLENWWTGAWHRQASHRTDGAGKAAFTVTPKMTNGMRLRFAGTGSHAACLTPMRMVWLTTDRRVVAEAARHKGQAYSYGAVGPKSFDCSGFLLYVVGKFGRTLPRNSQQQFNVLSHIGHSAALPGDLIFFGSTGSHITHVGIYAGGGEIWHAPSDGQTVKKQKIWTSAYFVARL